jgi:N12 class adenine-specific DNA methylase
MKSTADLQAMTIRKMNATESRLCELLRVPTDSLFDSASHVIEESGNFRAIQAIHNKVRRILANEHQPNDMTSLSKRLLTQQNSQIRSILTAICPAAQEQATLNHAESCVASDRLLCDQNQELLKEFAQILEMVGSKCVTNNVIISTTIQP